MVAERTPARDHDADRVFQGVNITVMAGLVPAIHVFAAEESKTWMPGTRPGMTECGAKLFWNMHTESLECDASSICVKNSCMLRVI